MKFEVGDIIRHPMLKGHVGKIGSINGGVAVVYSPKKCEARSDGSWWFNINGLMRIASKRTIKSQYYSLPVFKNSLHTEESLALGNSACIKNEEISMSKVVTTLSINGRNVKDLSSNDLIAELSNAKRNIKALEDVGVESKGITKKIEAEQDFIAEVVKLLDAKA